MRKIKGFTLMEMLVAILIVAVLAAVALPQYQKAVLKSRFSTLVPVAGTVAEGQEEYYYTHSRYSDDLSQLMIGATDTAGSTATYPGNINVEVGDDEDYSYVLASRDDLNNNYVVYQKHSANFAGDTHCEALAGNSKAEALCEGLQGKYIGDNADYKVYRLSGNGVGSFVKECTGEADTQRTCESGCGKQTRTVSCNPATGEYEYGDWEGECSKEPPTKQPCTKGTGEETREVTCNAEGTAWVEGTWNTEACKIECTGEPETQRTCESGCGKQTRTASCNTKTGEYEYGDWMGTCPTKPKDGTTSCGRNYIYTGSIQYTYKCNSAGTGYERVENNTCQLVSNEEATGQNCFSYEESGCQYTFAGGTCFAAGVRGGCNGNEYSVSGGCQTTVSTGCIGGVYNSGTHCVALDLGGGYYPTSNGCSNAVFKSGSHCTAGLSGSCSNNTFESGSYCSAEYDGACADNTYKPGSWCAPDYHGNNCAAGTPTKDGKCWDGAGNKVDC